MDKFDSAIQGITYGLLLAVILVNIFRPMLGL